MYKNMIYCFAQTLMNCIWFEQDVDESVENKRLHHQLLPDEITFERGFDDVSSLTSIWCFYPQIKAFTTRTASLVIMLQGRIHFCLFRKTFFIYLILALILQEVIAGLEGKGHRRSTSSSAGSVVQAILRKNGKLYAACDSRKGGAPDGY